MSPTGICFISPIAANSKTAHVMVVEHQGGALSIQISLTVKESGETQALFNLTASEAIAIGSNLEFLGNMIKVYQEEQH